MATEVAELLVKLEARVDGLSKGLSQATAKIDSFSKKSQRSFKRISRSVGRMLLRFTGISTALSGIASIAGFGALARGAIDAASAMDTFGIRLTNVLGSVEQANGLISDLAEFATQVAPSFRDIAGAAATLGTVALGSASKVKNLTQQATNIAAVTGLTLPQASSNLQRTLAQGIGAADLFRERGVRAIVEAVTQIPNLITQPLSVVEQAFEDTFGKDGVFGNAAIQFATTLPGAISIAGDAIFRFQNALGEAFGSAIIGFLTIFINTLNDVRKAIEENEQKVREFSDIALTSLAQIFIFIARSVISLASALATATVGFTALRLGLTKLLRIQKQLSLLTTVIGRGQLEDEIAALTTEIDELEASGVAAARAQQLLAEGFEAADANLSKLSANIKKFGLVARAEAAAEAARDPESEAALQRAFESVRPIDTAAFTEQAAGLKKVVSLLQQLGVENEKNKDAQLGEIAAIDVKIQKLDTVRVSLGAEVRARETQIRQLRKQVNLLDDVDDKKEKEGLAARLKNTELQLEKDLATQAKENVRLDIVQNDLLAQREVLAIGVNTAFDRLPAAHERARTAIAALALLDEDRALKLAEQLTAIDGQNLSLEKQLKLKNEIADEAIDEGAAANLAAADRLASDLVGPFQNAIGKSLRAAVSGEGVDFAESLADISGQLLSNSLSAVLEDLQDDVAKLFDKLDLGGLGKGFGRAIGAAVGIGGAILASALKSTQTDVKNDLVDTAVDQSREIRGIVAGPTDVPIAQVGNTIRDSFVPIRNLLQQLVVIGESQLALQGGAPGGTSSGGEETSDLDSANTAPILA